MVDKLKKHIKDNMIKSDHGDIAKAFNRQLLNKELINFFGSKTLGLQFTLQEIADLFGVTRERIRQIESSANKKMKHPTLGRPLRNYYEL